MRHDLTSNNGSRAGDTAPVLSRISDVLCDLKRVLPVLCRQLTRLRPAPNSSLPSVAQLIPQSRIFPFEFSRTAYGVQIVPAHADDSLFDLPYPDQKGSGEVQRGNRLIELLAQFAVLTRRNVSVCAPVREPPPAIRALLLNGRRGITFNGSISLRMQLFRRFARISQTVIAMPCLLVRRSPAPSGRARVRRLLPIFNALVIGVGDNPG